jgi:hypothetical protein
MMTVRVKYPICKGPHNAICKALIQTYLIRSISGLNFVAADFNRNGTPSVASMSLGGGISDALDSSVVRVGLMITTLVSHSC